MPAISPHRPANAVISPAEILSTIFIGQPIKTAQPIIKSIPTKNLKSGEPFDVALNSFLRKEIIQYLLHLFPGYPPMKRSPIQA